jgi:hypothetical protein
MNLRQQVNRLGREAQKGIFITCCNIAAIFQYGGENGAFAADFAHNQSTSTADAYVIAKQWASTTAPIDLNRHPYTDFSSSIFIPCQLFCFSHPGRHPWPNRRPKYAPNRACLYGIPVVPLAPSSSHSTTRAASSMVDTRKLSEYFASTQHRSYKS